MPPAKDSLRSTFPIPPSRIRGRKLKRALSSPVTWAPYLPVVGAFTFFDVGPLWFAGLTALVTAGLVGYWKNHHGKLEGKLLDEIIAESNAAQDQHLVTEIRSLQKRGFADYATTLGSFLERKRQIELAIHQEEGTVTSEKEEIESLVDSIVFGVSDQLERLARFDAQLTESPVPVLPDKREALETAKDEIATRVGEAWEVLDTTWANLGELIHPTSGLSGPDVSHSALDQAIDRLRTEHQIAARVKARMSEEWDGLTPEPIAETD